MEEKTFYEHIEEFRRIIIKSLLILMLFSIAAYFFSEEIIKILAKPLGRELVFLSPTEAFVGIIKISLIAGAFIAFPFIIHHIWKFISDIFTKDKKKSVSKYIIISIFLFYGAIIFCYFFVLPTTLKFLMNVGDVPLIPTITLNNYMDFTLYLLIAFGLIFQFPLILLALINLNIITVDMLRKKRRYFILGIFIVAAILTPTPDGISLLALALPIILLFEITIIIGSLKKKNNLEVTNTDNA